jgi:hypothetical protein
MSHTSPTPAIRVFGSHGVRSQPHSQSVHHQAPSNARPMAIPNAREQPPPPLPPPRYIGSLDIGEDPGWRYGNSRQLGGNAKDNGSLASVKPGSSLLGGGQPDQDYASYGDHYESRRGSTMSTSTLLSSSTLIDPEMRDADSLEHSDDDRNNTISRPGGSNFRYVSALRWRRWRLSSPQGTRRSWDEEASEIRHSMHNCCRYSYQASMCTFYSCWCVWCRQ